MKKRVIVKTCLICLLFLTAFFLCSCEEKTIDISSFVSLETDGIDGAGTASVVIDEAVATEAIGGKDHLESIFLKVFKNKNLKMLENNNPQLTNSFSDLYEIVLNKAEGLSIGETVIAKVVEKNPFNSEKANSLFYKKLNLSFSTTSLKVKGLFTPYSAKMYKESHVALFEESVFPFVKKYNEGKYEVSNIQIDRISYLSPKGTIDDSGKYSIYVSFDVYPPNEYGSLRMMLLIAENVYYSDKGKMIMNIRFEDDNRDGYDYFDKNLLYYNPNYR